MSPVRPRTALLGATHWHAPLYRQVLTERTDLVVLEESSATDAAIDMEVDLAVLLGDHRSMSKAARELLQARVPLILEKPGALDLVDLEEIDALARRIAVPVAVPLVHRNSALADTLGRVGAVTGFSARYLVGPPSRYTAAGSAWMLDPQIAGGGVLANLGPHFVDLFLTLIADEPGGPRRNSEPCASSGPAEPLIVKAVTSSATHRLDIEDHAALLLQTADGRTASIEVGYVAPTFAGKRLALFTAFGPDGMVTVGTNGEVVAVDASGRTTTSAVEVDSDQLFPPFVARAVERRNDGFAGLPTLGDLVAAMRVIRTAYREAGNRADDTPWAR